MNVQSYTLRPRVAARDTAPPRQRWGMSRSTVRLYVVRVCPFVGPDDSGSDWAANVVAATSLVSNRLPDNRQPRPRRTGRFSRQVGGLLRL